MISLYKWQEQALEKFLDVKHLIADVTTGAGKTQYSIQCIKELKALNGNINILIATPTIISIESVWLPALKSNDFLLNEVGVYYGFAKEYSKITLTTHKSIKNIPLEVFDVLIVDEVHHFSTGSFLKILNHKFQYKLGLSASIHKEDQKHWKLLEAFNYNVFKYGTKQAIQDGIINNFIFYDVAVEIKDPPVIQKYDELCQSINAMLKKVGGYDAYIMLPAGNQDKMKLQKLFNDRNELILNYKRKLEILLQIVSKNRTEKILIFNQYMKISTKISWTLLEHHIKSRIIDSKINRENRIKNIKDYEANKYNVLLTSRVLDESYNLPEITLCIILSGYSTQRQTIQRIGRILRKKDKPSIIYQIYVKNTFEETHALERTAQFKDMALQYVQVVV